MQNNKKIMDYCHTFCPNYAWINEQKTCMKTKCSREKQKLEWQNRDTNRFDKGY